MIFATAHGLLEYDARFQPRTPEHAALASFVVCVRGRGRDTGFLTYIRCSIGGVHAETMWRHLRRGKKVLVAGSLIMKQRSDGESYLTMRPQTLELLDPAPHRHDVGEDVEP